MSTNLAPTPPAAVNGHATAAHRHHATTAAPAPARADDTPSTVRPTNGIPDADRQLARAVRQTAHLRRGFYLVVLLVALTGQITAATHTLGIPPLQAIPALTALELGGIVVLANADVRRRLGEHAIGSRILSAGIAAAAVTFNWLAHPDHLLGGFFAGMSALGYLVWTTHTENCRRDRLRAAGALPPTSPAYELFAHRIRHPRLTKRAATLAKASPHLNLYDSLAAAHAATRAEHRRAAIAKVLHHKIRAAVDPATADIAIAVYDLDTIADRLTNLADYDSLTALIAHDLTPTRLAAAPPTTANPGPIDPRTAGEPAAANSVRALHHIQDTSTEPHGIRLATAPTATPPAQAPTIDATPSVPPPHLRPQRPQQRGRRNRRDGP